MQIFLIFPVRCYYCPSSQCELSTLAMHSKCLSMKLQSMQLPEHFSWRMLTRYSVRHPLCFNCQCNKHPAYHSGVAQLKRKTSCVWYPFFTRKATGGSKWGDDVGSFGLAWEPSKQKYLNQTQADWLDLQNLEFDWIIISKRSISLLLFATEQYTYRLFTTGNRCCSIKLQRHQGLRTSLIE